MASSNSCSSAEDFPTSERQKVMIIDELVQGRELATKLRALFSGAGESSDAAAEEISAGDLVSRIMKSFTNTLFLVDQNDTISSSPAESPCLDPRKSEDSDERNCRRDCSPAKAPNDRRGNYNRRKASNTWKRETPTLIDDGHAWRKYGQKVILKSDYPRNYFRCTHKYDQQCRAIKHVQRIQKEPPLYRTTYYGHHTCRDLQNVPEMVLDCASPTPSSSMLISFNAEKNDLNNLPTSNKHQFFSPSFDSASSTTHMKQEVKDESLDSDVPYCGNMMNNVMGNRSSSVAADFCCDFPYHDGGDYNLGHMEILSQNLEGDIRGDMISGFLDMDFFEDGVLQHLNF